MIALLLRRFALLTLIALVVLDIAERFNPNPPPLLMELRAVPADMPYCFTIKNPSLLRSPHDGMDYHPGIRFNDKGTA